MEEWKTVIYDNEVYEGYEVSTKGNVRSLNYRKKKGNIRQLTLSEDKDGYYYVRLPMGKGKQKLMRVHRMVGFTFIPNPNNYDTIDHIDRNKHNNCVENLRWLPHKNNIIRNGEEIRCVETGQEFRSIGEASREMNLQQSGISRVLSGDLAQTGGYTFEFVEEK